MNEEAMVNEAVEEQPAEEQFNEGMADAEFDSMWDSDDDDSFIESEVSEPVDQPEETNDAEAEQSQAEEQTVEDADQYLELKHFDEIRKVTKAEAKELAQKGMDYDRIRGKLSDAEANLAKLQKYEGFLNEMKGDFESIDDLINDSRARVLADKENISYEEAVNRIQTNIQKQQIEQKLSPEAIRETMRRESLQTFLQTYPDVKPKDIPQEVWDDMNKTNNLVASYAKYEAKKLAEENKILAQNAKNKARSTGSMKSSGKTYTDEYDRMWYEDDD